MTKEGPGEALSRLSGRTAANEESNGKRGRPEDEPAGQEEENQTPQAQPPQPQPQAAHQQPQQQPPHQQPEPAQRTFAQAAAPQQGRGEYFTVPAFAREKVFEGEKLFKVKPLPLSEAEFPTDDPTPVAARLCAPFADMKAILLGERLFILRACARAAEIVVVKAADRDPLIIFRRLSPVPLSTAPADRTRFVTPPALAEAIPLGDLTAVNFFLAQALGAGAVEEQIAKRIATTVVTKNPFKTHAVVAVESAVAAQAVSDNAVLFYPRNWFLRSERATHTATIRCTKASDSLSVARLLLGKAPFHFIQSKAMLRIGFLKPHTPEQLTELAGTPGVASISADASGVAFHNAAAREAKRQQQAQAGKPAPDANELRIRRADGNPIDNSTAAALTKALGLKAASLLPSGCLRGVCARAAELHEVCLNNLFFCFRPAAPDPEIAGDTRQAAEV